MKKFLAIILALAMVLSMGACGSKETKCDHEGFTSMKQITSQQGKVIYLEYTCSNCGEKWTIDAKDCPHESIYKKPFSVFFDDKEIDGNYYIHCSDCGLEWHEYNEEYTQKINALDEYAKANTLFINDNTSKEIPCPKCNKVADKTSSKYIIDPRHCPYCGFDKLWGTTLTEKQAIALKGKPAEEIREKCKTCGDALIYLKSNGMKSFDHNNIDFPKYGNNGKWEFGYPGNQALDTNWYTNCFGATNFVNYLVSDDYNDISIIVFAYHTYDHVGGGHGFSAINIGNKWYTVDLHGTQLDSKKFGLKDVDSFTITMDNLEDFATMHHDGTTNFNFLTRSNTHSDAKDFQFVAEIKPMGKNYVLSPSRWKWDGLRTKCNFILPLEVEPYAKTIYRMSPNDGLLFEKFENTSIPGWNCPIE